MPNNFTLTTSKISGRDLTGGVAAFLVSGTLEYGNELSPEVPTKISWTDACNREATPTKSKYSSLAVSSGNAAGAMIIPSPSR